MTMLYTEEQMARINDRLNNARQIVQFARSDKAKRDYLLDEAHRILGELAESMKDGFVELIVDGTDTADECYTIEDEIEEAMKRG